MLILKVNDKPVLHPKTFAEAVRKGGRTVKLQVVDPRSGRTSEINVSM